MNRVIELGKYKRKTHPLVYNAKDRVQIETEGSRSQKRELKRLEEKENFRYGSQEEQTMVVTIRQLNHPHFISAMHKLDNCSSFEPQVAWNVMKLLKKCHATIKENRELYQKTTKNYAQLDESGEVKIENGQILYKSPEDEKAHSEEFEKFMAVEVEITAGMLKLSELAPVKLSPSELEALEPVIDPTSIEG